MVGFPVVCGDPNWSPELSPSGSFFRLSSNHLLKCHSFSINFSELNNYKSIHVLFIFMKDCIYIKLSRNGVLKYLVGICGLVYLSADGSVVLSAIARVVGALPGAESTAMRGIGLLGGAASDL